MTNVRRAMAKGAAWMVLARFADRAVGLVSTLILARVLAPHDFGIVAMAMSFVALLELTTAFGLETALVQQQARDRAQFDTAWTYQILFGIVIGGGMVGFAAPIAAFFGEPALADVLRVLALGFLAQSFQNIGIVTFRIDMQFDREFTFLVAKKLLGFVVTVGLAFWLRSYWALVLGQVVSRAGGTILSFAMHSYRPRTSLAAGAALFGFSKWVLILNWIGYVLDRAPDWVLGRMLGPSAVGVFGMASELARLPTTEISAPVNRAVFSGYARLAGDRASLAREYLAVLGLVALVACPAALGVSATAPLLVPVLLGGQWLEAVPVIQVLAIFALMSVFQSNASALYLAAGRADLPSRIAAAQATLQVALMIALVKSYGVVGGAIACLAAVAAVLPASFAVIVRMLAIRVTDLVHVLWRPVAGAVAMYAAVAEVDALLGTGSGFGGSIARLTLAVTTGACTYVAAVALLWTLAGRPDTSAESLLLARAREWLASRRRAERPS